MDALTDAQLDELERLEQAATPCTAWESGSYTIGAQGLGSWCWEICGDNDRAAEDAACFAAARNALPALIAEVRRYRREKALDALSRQAQERGEYSAPKENPPG